VRSLGLIRTTLLSDNSLPTRLELSNGNWEAIVANLSAGPIGSIASMSTSLHEHVGPSAASPSTRAKDWTGWHAVLTRATARGRASRPDPTSSAGKSFQCAA
jgi:hypothetical protein